MEPDHGIRDGTSIMSSMTASEGEFSLLYIRTGLIAQMFELEQHEGGDREEIWMPICGWKRDGCGQDGSNGLAGRALELPE